jgi:hypothetical protein
MFEMTHKMHDASDEMVMAPLPPRAPPASSEHFLLFRRVATGHHSTIIQPSFHHHSTIIPPSFAIIPPSFHHHSIIVSNDVKRC